MTIQMQNNQVTLTGKVVSQPRFSHEIYGERFFDVDLEVKRLSQTIDVLPISISERFLCEQSVSINDEITVMGQFRSYNKMVDGHSKLMLTVFVKSIVPASLDSNPNLIELTGYICKPPIFRTTPFNREICDVLLAVNRAYNKSDYIPCIVWGRNARFCKSLPVGQAVTITGRIQSRIYQKKLSEDETVSRTAYEVSVSKITSNQSNFVYDDVDNRLYQIN